MGSKGDKMISFRQPFYEIARECLAKVPNLIVNRIEDASSVERIKDDGDPSTMADMLAEEIACKILSVLDFDVDLYSEERGYLLKSDASEFVIQMDPIDGTYLALRRLPGACMAITVFSKKDMKPVAALVADYYNGDIYWADENGSLLNGEPVRPSTRKTLEEAVVSTCYGKRTRFGRILDDARLVGRAFWVSTNGGILDMVRVATGQIDVYLDLMLGFKPYDFSAGAFIAEKAGACVVDEYGEKIVYPADPNQRCKFIIAANKDLLRAIINAAND